MRRKSTLSMVRMFSGTLGLLLYFFSCCSASASTWLLGANEKEGLPLMSYGGAEALSTSFAFWDRKWKWAHFERQFKVIESFKYEITGKSKQLNIDLQGVVTRASSHQMVWNFLFDAKSDREIIGGGLVFKFNLQKFANTMGIPEILPGKSGWSWGKGNGPKIEVSFAPPLESLRFNKKNKGEIRAFFYKNQIPQGKRSYKVTLTTTPDINLTKTISERFGLSDYKSWPTSSIDRQKSPVDLSYLNESEKPAGKRGFLKVAGDKLVFEDGTHARFWGANLSAYAIFGTPENEVKQQAKRLSRLGFNLVRLHHHDSPWVNPNVFGNKEKKNTRLLDPKSMKKIDFWIKCLKDEGIYIWLDLHVQRKFKPGDRIDYYEEIGKGKRKGNLKGYSYVNESIQEAMKSFNQAYVTHKNQYTGIQYKDDPAIAVMMITNENDVTHHFGNILLPNKSVPKHTRLYMEKARIFAKRFDLHEGKVWRSWEHGPSKLFLNDLEHRFNQEMIEHLQVLGVKVPIVTTSLWKGNSLSSLPALTDGDIIDVHSYGGLGELEKSPLVGPNMMHKIASAQVAGKPLSVSEWNVKSFPAPDRHIIPLYMAAMATYQGWDAVILYAYAQGPLDKAGRASNWNSYNDPALMATIPAAALLYRNRHVEEAKKTYLLSPGKDNLFNKELSPETSIAIRTSAEKGKLLVMLPEVEELPWLKLEQLKPDNTIVITNPDQTFIRGNETSVSSDTKELKRNWVNGTYEVNTDQTQAVHGWVGGMEINLKDITVESFIQNASVIVQSLDQKSIAESEHILVSAAAASMPSIKRKLPYYSEPLRGVLKIRAQKGMQLFTNSDVGKKGMLVPYKDGYYTIDLGSILKNSSHAQLKKGYIN